MKRIHFLFICLSTFALVPTAAWAQAYPQRAVTLVIPYAAGTGLDGMGRALANNLAKSLGQPVVVENRAGAGTNIGLAYVANSKPDGYTLVLGANSGLAANKSLYRQMGFDPQADLTPVAFLGKGSMVVLTTSASGVNNMADLVKLAKASPAKLNFGAANTTARVWIELIQSMTGVSGETINYTNAGQMLADLMGGQVNFAVENTGTSRALISSGKLKPLAVTSKVRGNFNAAVPTLTEAGLGNFEVDTWYAIFAPKSTPPDIVKRLNTEINALWKNPEFVRAADFVEVAGGGGTPEELGAFQSVEIDKWRELVNKTGIRLD